MAIIKGFVVDIVDGTTPDANIIQNIGNCIVSILEEKSTFPTGSGKVTLNTTVDYMSRYSDEYLEGGGCFPTTSTIYANYKTISQTLYPLLNIFDGLTLPTGYHIRLKNSSGFYALVERVIPVLYDNNGTLIGYGLNNLFGGSYTQYYGMYADGVITDITRYTNLVGYDESSMSIYGENAESGTNRNNSISFLNNCEQYIEDTDPYAHAGDSDTGGGDGTFDGSSDPVPIPSLPTVGATDAGFITLFAPTSAQLHALASYCWSNLFDVDTFKKLFNDPMDCILGLSVVPVSVPTSGEREITVGNIVTTVQMNVASQQYIEVDCGSISFANKYFGSYLDYEPYTKMAIFLPYCGTHQISADDVMGKTITVKYHIDILTGSCIAFVKCGDSVLYEFNGACASNIPVNSLNYSSTIENAIRIAVNIGTTVATAGASAPLSTATEGASALATAQNIGRGISLAGSTAEGALSMKPSVSRSGAMGGGVGLLGNQIPYIIITRPRLCKPKNQDHFEGYPSFIYSKIEDLIGQGFTSFTDVIISEQFLTDEEENELEAILKGGVYL